MDHYGTTRVVGYRVDHFNSSWTNPRETNPRASHDAAATTNPRTSHNAAAQAALTRIGALS